MYRSRQWSLPYLGPAAAEEALRPALGAAPRVRRTLLDGAPKLPKAKVVFNHWAYQLLSINDWASIIGHQSLGIIINHMGINHSTPFGVLKKIKIKTTFTL